MVSLGFGGDSGVAIRERLSETVGIDWGKQRREEDAGLGGSSIAPAPLH